MYGFEDFRLEPGERRLWRGDRSVALTPKTFHLLLFLVEHDGRLLRKDDLLSSIWPDAAVEENNLTVAASALRKALGESEARRFIETVPKTGYRFVAQVTELQAATPSLPLDGTGSANRSEGATVKEREAARNAAPDSLLQQTISRGEISGRFRFLTVALMLAALIALGYLALPGRFAPKRMPTTPRRLAILPFRNLRGNAQDEFLALSLADAVITKLGSI